MPLPPFPATLPLVVLMPPPPAPEPVFPFTPVLPEAPPLPFEIPQ
jgi:hypothetical protein